MSTKLFPVIDPVATGENIARLRRERGFTVRDLQRYFGFEEPQAIYKWQRGESLPSVDNLYALSSLFGVSMNEILVSTCSYVSLDPQASTWGSDYILLVFSLEHFIRFLLASSEKLQFCDSLLR